MKWVLKTSTLRIVTKDKDRVYHSIEDLPPETQEIIRQTLRGPNTETIFIANQEAYSRIAGLAEELTGEMKPMNRRPLVRRRRRRRRGLSERVVLGIAFSALALGSLLWLAISQIGTP
jgi:hypothetical protein